MGPFQSKEVKLSSNQDSWSKLPVSESCSDMQLLAFSKTYVPQGESLALVTEPKPVWAPSSGELCSHLLGGGQICTGGQAPTLHQSYSRHLA